jgi:hypothetical protein
MVLLDVGGFGLIIISIYFIFHIPAILMLIFAFVYSKSKPAVSKKLLILAAIYFLIGGGICGAILS